MTVMDAEQELVAGEIRAMLARRRMSAATAAVKLGWSQTYLSRRMRGEVSFSVADLLALAKLLKVKVIDFFPADSAFRKEPFSRMLGAA